MNNKKRHTMYVAVDRSGLTKPSGAFKAIEEMIEMERKLTINLSGGLIDCGHLVGATGVRQLLDAYKQIAGTAGEYGVLNAKRVATLNIGDSATTNVSFIIGRVA